MDKNKSIVLHGHVHELPNGRFLARVRDCLGDYARAECPTEERARKAVQAWVVLVMPFVTVKWSPVIRSKVREARCANG